MPGPAGRIVREEKSSHTRSTPTGSLNSFDEATPSPDTDKYAGRRGQEPPQQMPQMQSPPQQPPQQSSDLPVSVPLILYQLASITLGFDIELLT